MASPLFDLDAAAAARILLTTDGEPASRSVARWVSRLSRGDRKDLETTLRSAGNAISVLHDPDAVGLSAAEWDVDRLVSAGRASGERWALSGWAALDAMGHDLDAATIFWVDDVRLITQLLADTMRPVPVDRADVIVTRGDDDVFAHTVDVEEVILVDAFRALLDSVGLGGAAESIALEVAGAPR